MFPPAPGRFSTITLPPSDSASFGAIKRASVSVTEPGANATTNEIGFCFGHSWALAVETASSSAAAAAILDAFDVVIPDVSGLVYDVIPDVRRTQIRNPC